MRRASPVRPAPLGSPESRAAPTTADGVRPGRRCSPAAVAVIRATGKSADDEKQAAAEADQAMTWLKRAVAAGYKSAKNLKEDKDLAALRDREDFKTLLVDLETAKPKEKK
jgi:hypothetical protein